MVVNIHMLRTISQEYLRLSRSDTCHSERQVSRWKNSNKIFHEAHCRLPYHTSVRYFCNAGFDTTFFCLSSIRQSSILAPGGHLPCAPSQHPNLQRWRPDLRSRRPWSQWHAAAHKSTKRTFPLREAKLRAWNRCTAIAIAAEYSTSSSRAMLASPAYHLIKHKLQGSKHNTIWNIKYRKHNTVDQKFSNKSSEARKIVHIFSFLYHPKDRNDQWGEHWIYIARSDYKKSWQYLQY